MNDTNDSAWIISFIMQPQSWEIYYRTQMKEYANRRKKIKALLGWEMWSALPLYHGSTVCSYALQHIFGPMVLNQKLRLIDGSSHGFCPPAVVQHLKTAPCQMGPVRLPWREEEIGSGATPGMKNKWLVFYVKVIIFSGLFIYIKQSKCTTISQKAILHLLPLDWC